MLWRRLYTTAIAENDAPFLAHICPRRCGCPEMRWRVKQTRRFGGASPCKIDINGYDGAQTGYYRRLNISVVGRWKRNDTNAVVESCSSTGLYISVDGNVPSCSSDSGGTYECDAPAICGTVSCRYEEETTYAGENEVTADTAAAAARANETEVEEPWSEWLTGHPLSLDGGSTDSRNAGSASYTERTLFFETAGAFVPFLIRRLERVVVRDGDTLEILSTTDEVIDLPVLTSGAFSIDWPAEANTTRSILDVGIWVPR